MARKKRKGTELGVFKGREARLNRAIFQALATKGPQSIYEIQKQTQSTKGLKNTRYASVNKRAKVLEEMGYIKKTSVRKAKFGFETSIYELKVQAYLAMLLDSFNLEDLILQLDEEAATAIHRKFLRLSSSTRKRAKLSNQLVFLSSTKSNFLGNCPSSNSLILLISKPFARYFTFSLLKK